jgi:hypothetical protein
MMVAQVVVGWPRASSVVVGPVMVMRLVSELARIYTLQIL